MFPVDKNLMYQRDGPSQSACCRKEKPRLKREPGFIPYWILVSPYAAGCRMFISHAAGRRMFISHAAGRRGRSNKKVPA